MKIKNVVVIGAGAMGSGIAQIAVMAGYNVTLVDIKDEYIAKGIASIEKGLNKLEEKGKLKGTSAATLLGNVKTTTDLANAAKDADFCLEAVIENMDVKKQVFKTLGDNAPKHCILASNTSSMSISEIANASGREEKVCGVHFFNPAPLMRLVEIIKGDETSDATVAAARSWSYSLPCLKGKRYCPIVLKDRPGFIANRVNAPTMILLQWTIDQCAEKGIPFEQLDNDAFNPMSPMGPLVLTDYVGLDIAFHTMQYYTKTLHPDFTPGKVLTEYVEKGQLGMKTGKGLFEWPKGKKPILERTKKANLFTVEELYAIQANESCRLLEEGVVKDWTTIDKTMDAGYNAPGPMAFLVDGNREKWPELLNELADKTGKEYLRPCELMKSGAYRELRIVK
ncbi:MAG: 3-hydroxyacyl-CoA dehydrogenase NAD-binding domain-containing protein [Promethearchaeota archaeon]